MSVQASEGRTWFFPRHRSLAITPHADIEHYKPRRKIPDDQRLEAEAIINGILDKKGQFCGDDIYDDVPDLFPGRAPQIIGFVVRGMKRRGLIHEVGYRKSVNKTSHFNIIAVWERVKK